MKRVGYRIFNGGIQYAGWTLMQFHFVSVTIAMHTKDIHKNDTHTNTVHLVVEEAVVSATSQLYYGISSIRIS